ncbi:hypothetical protein B0H13DRAFT_2209570, partial [Mycena leptocephala]
MENERHMLQKNTADTVSYPSIYSMDYVRRVTPLIDSYLFSSALFPLMFSLWVVFIHLFVFPRVLNSFLV